MKKSLILFITVLCTSTLLHAQSNNEVSSKKFKAFKFDIGIGYATPSNGSSNAVGGFTFTLEPHYRLSDALAVGLRFEGAALGFKDLSNNVTVSVLSSYCATGEYYFSNNGFRPFAGAGFGIFTQQSVTVNSGSSTTVTTPGQSNFGFFPRLGFETGHFRMSGEYNSVDNGGYIALKLGFFFGGGKK
ncbi:MAG: hypothetical protein JSR09_04875 [Bacteroidetes bacterium]|nr:hypothetical protein [Bacteroidota bacterium]MBS1649020.1 hypothetical protein [Bacteroidota bacterium]